MSEFLDALLKSNIINFIITALLIAGVLYKLNIAGKLKKNADDIKDYTLSAENEKIESQKKLDIINGKVQKLPELIDRIKKSTENSVKNYEKKVQSDIEEEKLDMSKNSQRILNLETNKFKNELIQFLSEKSVETARKNAIERLNENKELHNVYIDRAIEELDRINL